MEDKGKQIREVYAKKLRPFEYVSTIQKEWNADEAYLKFPLQVLYDLLQSGKFKGSRLLEIGSGALVHNVAPATALYPNIIMSDYVEENCDELKRWLKGESKLYQFLDFPAELEGYTGNLEAGRKLLEDRVRKCVKQVVRCDVLTDNVFMEEVKSEVSPPYDLIISIGCLECAAPDLDSFTLILKRINKLLRKGGGLFIMGFFEASTIWKVDDAVFNYLRISEVEMRKALKDSGFGNIDMKLREKLKLNIAFDHDKFYCLSAEKL